MNYLGDFATGQTIYIPFSTFNSAGASVTLTGLAVTDVEIYKDGSITQRASDNGITLLDTDGIDFDGITGLHGFKIDLSDNTDNGFYAAGHDYMVAVSAVTVDSQAISFWACSFSIQNRYMRGTDSAALATTLATVATYVDTEVAAIKAVTDLIPNAGAMTSIAQASALATVDARLDTEIPALVSDIATIKAVTDAIPNSGAMTSIAQASALSTVVGYTDTLEAGQASLAATLAIIDARLDTEIPALVSDIATIKAVTNALPNSGTLSSLSTAAALAAVDARLDTEIPALISDVAAIKTITDAIPNSGSMTSIAQQNTLSTVAGYLDTEITSILSALNTITGYLDTEITSIISSLSALNNIDVGDILDGVIEGTTTLKESIRLINSALAGKVSGAATSTITFRDLADSKNRIIATVDENGNRSAITKDLT